MAEDSVQDTAGYTLLRYDCTKPDQPGQPGEQFVEVMTGHPPIPRAGLPTLKRHVTGVHAPAETPARWWHRSGVAWSAVVELHRDEDHATALELARLLAWCEHGGSRAEPFVFEIREEARRG